MKFLLLTLLSLPIFGQLLRLPLFNRIGLVPTDVFVFLVVGIWFLRKIQKSGNMLQTPLLWPSITFFSWAFISLIFNMGALELSGNEALLGFAYFMRFLGYFLLIFVFWSEMKKEDIFFWKNTLFISAFLIALIGFLQLKFFPSFYALNMQDEGWDPHIGRLLSTWFDPNFLGGYFAFILALIGGDLWQQWKEKQWGKYSWFLAAIVCVLLSALALTYSRSAYLAFLVAGGVFALIAERRLLIVGALGIMLMLSVSDRAQERVSDAWISAQALFTQTEKTLDPTSRLRLQSWNIGWDLFAKNPVTGIGFNNHKTVQKSKWSSLSSSHAGSGIDSSILTVMATTGTLGIMAYLWIFWDIFKSAWQNYVRKNDGFSLGFFAGLCGIFVHAMFVNMLFFSLFLPTLFLSVAIILKRNRG
jgi:O-antigen ligase